MRTTLWEITVGVRKSFYAKSESLRLLLAERGHSNLLTRILGREFSQLIVMPEREIAFLAERFGAEEDAPDVRMLRLDVFAQATCGLSDFEG